MLETIRPSEEHAFCLWQGIGTGFIIAGTLSVIEVPSLESDNTKPLLDPVLSDPFQAGGMAFGLSTLIITIGLVILGVAGLGIFLISGKWFQIKRMLAIVSKRQQ